MEQIQAVLARDRQLKRERRSSNRRRKSPEELARYLVLPVDDPRRVGDPCRFATLTYNLAHQVRELVSLVLAPYEPPPFLWRSILSEEGRVLVLHDPPEWAQHALSPETTAWEQELFLTYGQGRSLWPLLKGWIVRAEIPAFLNGPHRMSAHQKVAWAKLISRKVPMELALGFMLRVCLPNRLERLGERRKAYLDLIATLPPGISAPELDALTTYLSEVGESPDFDPEGKTIPGLLRIARDWALENRFGPRGEFRRWERRFELWECRGPAGRVRATELHTTWALHAESARQQHCVFTYLEDCVAGDSHIVSFHFLDRPGSPRVTARVCPTANAVTMALGRFNRRMDRVEWETVTAWAVLHGLRVHSTVRWDGP